MSLWRNCEHGMMVMILPDHKYGCVEPPSVYWTVLMLPSRQVDLGLSASFKQWEPILYSFCLSATESSYRAFCKQKSPSSWLSSIPWGFYFRRLGWGNFLLFTRIPSQKGWEINYNLFSCFHLLKWKIVLTEQGPSLFRYSLSMQ